MELQKKLNEIQQKLKAPKNQFNGFGKYKYRNCEDILEAVKPLLNGAVLTISDYIKQVGDRYYIKAVATLTDGEETINTTAYAREPCINKGMNEAQITGATSSYARKYALNGLFLIDDTKDADTMDNKVYPPIKENLETTVEEPLRPYRAKLWEKLKNTTGKTELKEDEILKVISAKAGITIKNKTELLEEKCKAILELWN